MADFGNIAGVVKSFTEPLESDLVTPKTYVIWAKEIVSGGPEVMLMRYDFVNSTWVPLSSSESVFRVDAAANSQTGLTGTTEIDEVGLVNGSKVLLTNQDVTTENGIYVADGAGNLTRDPRYSTSVLGAHFIQVRAGASNGSKLMMPININNVDGFAIGVDTITYEAVVDPVAILKEALNAAGGADGAITKISLVGTELQFGGTGEAFNGNIDLAPVVSANEDVDADETFIFSTTTTDADPGDGNLRFNNATPGSVTELYVDMITSAGVDITEILTRIGEANFIYIQQISDENRFLAVQVSNLVVDATGYVRIPVSVQDSGTLPEDGEEVVFKISHTDKTNNTTSTIDTAIQPANFRAIGTTPVTVLSAPGADAIDVPMAAIIVVDHGGIDFSFDAQGVWIESAAGDKIWQASQANINTSADKVIMLERTGDAEILPNTDLVITANADSIPGDSNVTVYIMTRRIGSLGL